MAEYMGRRFDDGTGKREPGHTRYELPDRHELPFLTFDGIRHYNGIAEAAFTGRDGQPYSVKKEQIERALRAEQHERESGMTAYDLPWFTHARNQIGYKQSSLDWQYRREAVTGFAAQAAWFIGSRLGGGAVLTAALLGGASSWSDHYVTSPFNQAVGKSLANTRFAISLEDRTAAAGSPDTVGYSWDFAVSPHKACKVMPDKPRNSWLEAKLRTVYAAECAPVEAWPENSPAKQLYAPAFTAYLQLAKPDHPPKLEDVDLALKNKRAFDAIQMP